MAGRAPGSLAGSQVASDWNPILGMKRFMDWGQKDIIAPRSAGDILDSQNFDIGMGCYFVS